MVKNLFTLLTSRQTSILSGAAIIMATVILAKVLGLIRDRLLVHIFPTDVVAIFLAAFGLPDFIFQIFIFGALSVAFIPVFTEYLEGKGKKEAFELATSVLNLSLVVLVLLSILVFVLADPLIGFLIVPGFGPEQKQQVVSLTRII